MPDSPASSPAAADGLPSPLDRVTCEPPPDWAESTPYDGSFRGRPEEAYSYLLIEQHHHHPLHAVHHHTVRRIESAAAVPLLSPWQLTFDPATQRVALHQLRVLRGTHAVDHSSPARWQLLRPEPGPGPETATPLATLGVALENLRPGDIIEAAYTVTTQPRVLAEHGVTFFTLPDTTSVGRYHFTVQGAAAPSTAWRTAVAEHLPGVETTPAGTTLWRWQGEKHLSQRTETQVPAGRLPRLWVQVSDVPDWATVARALLSRWPAPGQEDDEVAAEIARLAATADTREDRIEHALRLVQDELHHEGARFDPANPDVRAPAEVLRRRSGDGPALAWLLVHLLRGLGANAHAVLVATAGGEHLPLLLPSLSPFDRVVVELELDGEKRWIDPLRRQQGGGPRGRYCPDFGAGLVLAPDATGPAPAPPRPVEPDSYEVHETLLLDTTLTGHSLLRIQVRATGRHADALRHRLVRDGPAGFAEERRKQQASRYQEAEVALAPEMDDQRPRNAWRMLELFRVRGFVDFTGEAARCPVALPIPPPLALLAVPELGPRITPWTLPEELQFIHDFEVRSRALAGQPPRRREFSRPWAGVGLVQSFRPGCWSRRLALGTYARAVEPAQVGSHRDWVREVWREAAWSMHLPAGFRRDDPPPQFAVLPPPIGVERPGSQAPFAPPAPAPVATPPTPPEETAKSRRHRRRRHRQHRRGGRSKHDSGALRLLGTIALVLLVIRVMLFLYDSR